MDHAGTNACDSPIAKAIVLNEFPVDHQRFFANFTVSFDAGVVKFLLENPLNCITYEKQFSSSGSDSVPVEDPTKGVGTFRVECPAHVQLDLEWHLVVEALTKA